MPVSDVRVEQAERWPAREGERGALRIPPRERIAKLERMNGYLDAQVPHLACGGRPRPPAARVARLVTDRLFAGTE